MIKAFKVAGQVFCLQLPDGSDILQYLSQYDPFEVDSAEDAIFTLSKVEKLERPEGMKLLYKSPGEDPGEPTINLYSTPDGSWFFEMSPMQTFPVCAWMKADADLKKAEIELGPCRDRGFAINNALMLLYAFATSDRNILEMHASVIKYRGKAYLFLGKSGTGKSTHSKQWLKAIKGTSLLNDDNPIVRVEDDGTVMVYGSPWSGKTPCYKNECCPAGAFVRIRQAPENRIERMPLVESYAIIYSSSSGYKSDRRMSDGLHATMEKVVTTTPCYILDCLPNEDAALVCAKEVVKDE
ncbi:MAG: hypothetical protein IJU69_04445 [Bacteroidales bacterium]|nr:hypothetical protein [Bacteroidales bacterium]